MLWNRNHPAGHHTSSCGEIIEDLGEDNLRVPSPASFSKERSNSLTVSFICWSGLGGCKCHVLGADRIARGSRKSREASDVQATAAVGLAPWIDAHLLVEQIALTNIGRFHALYSFSRTWEQLPKYCKSSCPPNKAKPFPRFLLLNRGASRAITP